MSASIAFLHNVVLVGWQDVHAAKTKAGVRQAMEEASAVRWGMEQWECFLAALSSKDCAF